MSSLGAIEEVFHRHTCADEHRNASPARSACKRCTLKIPHLVREFQGVSGDEVDFVIERGARVFPVEVKMTGRPRPEDIKGLRVFLGE